MTAGWFDGAIKDPHKPGGAMSGGNSRGVFHTTEGYSHDGGRNRYHFTIGNDAPTRDERRAGTGNWVLTQWRSVDLYAYSLRNEPGGVQTNKEGDVCIQIAFAWQAALINVMPDEAWALARTVMDWARDTYGIPAVRMEPVKPDLGNNCYGIDSPCRYTEAEWVAGSGWCEHKNATENTHWDAGMSQVEWDKLLTEEDEMQPQSFEVGVENPFFEPFALRAYRVKTGESWEGLDSSVIAAELSQPDVRTPSQETMDLIYGLANYPTNSVLYGPGKEATLFTDRSNQFGGNH